MFFFVFFKVMYYSFMLFLCCVNYNEGFRGLRIAGGRIADPGEFPFAVVILSEYICGGGLVNMKRVVTAGHCLLLPIDGVLTKLNINKTNVIGGSINLEPVDDGYQKRKIQSFRVHEGYRFRKNSTKVMLQDIGVIELVESFENSQTVKPMEFISYDVYEFRKAWSQLVSDEKSCLSIGWGKSQEESFSTSVLKVVKLKHIKHKTCKTNWPSSHFEDDMYKYGEVCLIPIENSEGACAGDSGSPLICDGHPYGLLNVGLDCGTKTPHLYLLYWNYIEYFQMYSDEVNHQSKATRYTTKMSLFFIFISCIKIYK